MSITKSVNSITWQRDFADAIRIKNLKIGRSPWIIQDSPICSQELLKSLEHAPAQSRKRWSRRGNQRVYTCVVLRYEPRCEHQRDASRSQGPLQLTARRKVGPQSINCKELKSAVKPMSMEAHSTLGLLIRAHQWTLRCWS